jgi:uncharacterized membrane protein YcaP (DUF421 family)
MWQLSAPWWEFVLRAAIVYILLMVLLRLSGKRQVGQLAPFDLVLLLILSNAVQNAMNGGDNSVAAGLILAATLVVLNYIVAIATYRHPKLETLVEGRPEVLVHDGTRVQTRDGSPEDYRSRIGDRSAQCGLRDGGGSASRHFGEQRGGCR